MRPRLLHPLRERDGSRRRRDDHHPAQQRPARAHAAPSSEAAAAAEPAPGRRAAGGCDPAVDRVRDAGGPMDTALYTCGCGYLFSAAVSTTVSCPHCGTGQAW
jgi:hypothetical protein